MTHNIVRTITSVHYRQGGRVALLTACAALLTACIASEPQTRVRTLDSFAIVTVEDQKAQKVDEVAIQDMGEVKDLIRPIQIQACEGSRLLFKEVRTSQGIRRERVMVTVDPLLGVYVRRLRVTNDTTNVLNLNRADAVLVDAAGNDNELADTEIITQNILARFPCGTGQAAANTLRPLKMLGSDVRIRPGREVTFYAMFLNVDPSIVGDWILELNDFPVQTDAKGEVSKVAQFKFDLIAKGFRTRITEKKMGLLSPWVETDRATEELVGN